MKSRMPQISPHSQRARAMPRKSPISTRGLLTAAVVLCIILWAAPSFSQTLDDPVLGKASTIRR